MAKGAKVSGKAKGKRNNKKKVPSSSDRVIKTRSMDAILGISELEVQAEEKMSDQYRAFESPSQIEESTNPGNKKVKIDQADIEEEVNYWKPSIVGYVAGANPPLNVIDGFVRRMWKNDVVKVGMLSHGVFIIRFQNLEQRDKVLNGGFIFFDKKPFIMKPWNSIDDFTKENVDIVPTWIQVRGLDIKYWGEASLFKIVGQIGKPIQVDDITKHRDRLLYPRVLIEVSLAQDFPSKITFTDEFDHDVELDVKYEWIPLICKNCSGMGHGANVCRNKVQTKKTWVPKEKTEAKKVTPVVDEDGFQMVGKGKKVQQQPEVETEVTNQFAILDFQVEKIVQEVNNTGEGADPSTSNG
ncbi:uncharacterized protein LOC133815249 [Humulus lupulus]|uniref:uncharacterized protein LOC133815249 n=1 Tax=Humulus lupulus TaxID=3486 RepID=UPI002B4175C9|nr:uncharacterized protein LOC133815249 [Humulus lupulus]